MHKHIKIILAVLCGLSFLMVNTLAKDNIAVLPDEELIVFNQNTLLPIVEPVNPDRVVRSLSVVVTAYSSTPWETWGDPFITAAGTSVRDGIVANNLLPFGTKIRLPEIYGDKVFVVEDRMHYRKKANHFDLWKSSYGEAKNFGVVYTYVEVLES